jgi:hypothetical protein
VGSDAKAVIDFIKERNEWESKNLTAASRT